MEDTDGGGGRFGDRSPVPCGRCGGCIRNGDFRASVDDSLSVSDLCSWLEKSES
jgi:hypothetical protein